MDTNSQYWDYRSHFVSYSYRSIVFPCYNPRAHPDKTSMFNIWKYRQVESSFPQNLSSTKSLTIWALSARLKVLRDRRSRQPRDFLNSCSESGSKPWHEWLPHQAGSYLTIRVRTAARGSGYVHKGGVFPSNEKISTCSFSKTSIQQLPVKFYCLKAMRPYYSTVPP